MQSQNDNPLGSTGCPVAQMSFGELSQYSQGGFDSAIQNTISTHIHHCQVCQEGLQRFESCQQTVRELLHVGNEDAEIDTIVEGSDHVTEMQLAAFIEKASSVEENQIIQNHVSKCHMCFQRLSTLEKAMAAVLKAERTPAAIKSLVKKEQPTFFSSIKIMLDDAVHRIKNSIIWTWEQRWPAPAVAFALGIFFILLISPQKKSREMVVMLANSSLSSGSIDDHVLSGSDNAPGSENDEPVMTLSVSNNQSVHFQWPAITGNGHYLVILYNQFDEMIFQQDVDINTIEISGALFMPSLKYTLLVTGVQKNGIRPVVRQKLQVLND